MDNSAFLAIACGVAALMIFGGLFLIARKDKREKARVQAALERSAARVESRRRQYQ